MELRLVGLQPFVLGRCASRADGGGLRLVLRRALQPAVLLLALLCAAALPTSALAQTTGSDTSIVSSVNPSLSGQSVAFTATVTDPSGRFTPTGSVTFTDTTTSTVIGSSALDGAGQASISTSSLSGGNHTIVADYSGDGNLDPSSNSLVQQVLSGSATSTALSSSQNPSTVGQSVTFTATVTGISTPTGSVTFTDTTTSTVLGAVALNGAGQAAVTTSSLTTGAHSVTADYSGDLPTFDPSSDTLTQNVNPKSTSTTALSSSQNPSSFGQSVTFTATVTDPGGHNTPTGSVTFKDGAATLGSGTLDGSGQTTFSTSALSVGPHSISAEYGGDAIFDPSNDALTQTVNAAGTTTTLASSLNPSAFGQFVTFTATVSGSVGTPTGSVTFKDGGSTIGSGTLDGSGQATFATSSLSVGPHTITAEYGGDTNNAASTSSPLAQTVNQSGTTTTLASSQNPSSFGQSVTFTATVSGSGGTPTGTVTFKDGATTLGSGTLDGSGQATFTTASLALGSHSITAVYGGDGSFTGSTSAVLVQSVDVPADSLKLRAMQIAATTLEAQSSGGAVSDAIDDAVSEGFDDSGEIVALIQDGVRLNFTGEMPKRSDAEARIDSAFSALAYANSDHRGMAETPVDTTGTAQLRPPRNWHAWAEARGTGWDTDAAHADITGGQINGLFGITRRLTPNLLVGVLGGYETFDYRSDTLDGRLTGEGWMEGGYLGLRLFQDLRFQAGVTHSDLSYDDRAGTAKGSFPGERWIVTSSLSGSYRARNGFGIEPSARVFALWEHQDAYTDSLGIAQAERTFSTGRASGGGKISYALRLSEMWKVNPYVGGFADYRFTSDDASSSLLPNTVTEGWSGRAVTGLALTQTDGARLSIGGELGGIGTDNYKVWSVRGAGSLPF